MGRQSVVTRALAIVTLACVLTAALWLTASPEALACECSEPTRWTIEHADAALVGRIVAVFLPEERGWSEGQIVAKVEVITDIKENLSDIVYISNTRDEDLQNDSCGGVTWRPGRQIRTPIREDNGALYGGGVCTWLPDVLVNSWKPAVTTGGQATLLISGGQFSGDTGIRHAAYDRTGAPIAFVFEPGLVISSSICPGQRALTEVVIAEKSHFATLDTRSLQTFEITSSVRLNFEGQPPSGYEIRCDSPDGSTVSMDGYVIKDGKVLRADRLQDFPQSIDIPYMSALETSTTAPISGAGWMEFAQELDPPITIDATGASAAVAYFGPGYSFGLADALASTAETGIGVDELAAAAAATDDADDELAVGADPSAETNSNSVVWIVGLVVAFAASAVIFRSRR